MNNILKPAIKIALIYVSLGAIWILISDVALLYLFADKGDVAYLQTIKGWFYVLTTGGLLFWLSFRQLKTIEQSEERWRIAMEATGDGVWDWDVPTNTVWFSKGFKTMLGYNEDEIGTELDEWASRVHPQDMPDVMADLQPHLDGYKTNYTNEHRIRCKNGSYIWILDRGQVIKRDSAGKPIRVVGTHTDITERKQSQEKLNLAATVFTHAGEGIVIADAERNIIDVNDTFTAITGYSREEVIGKNPRFLQSGHQSPAFYAAMWHSINTKGSWSGEVWNKRKNGQMYAETLTLSTVKNADQEISHYVALLTDITQIKEHQTELSMVANYDMLTHLPNRALLADRLTQTLLQSRRHNQSLAVLFIDLDGFKHINDLHGHDVGDELLITLAKRIKEELREGDTLARVGGDEFVAVLADLAKIENADAILERLLFVSSEPVSIGNLRLTVSASIGVTFYPQDNVDAELLLRHADQAMYTAKEQGKNRYYEYDTAYVAANRLHREKLESIRDALDKQQFVLHYQPKVNMRTGEVIGFEALIRWQHPQRGLLTPNEFLPAIENNALSIELGEWVIDKALTQISIWQQSHSNYSANISVNIAALQIEQSNFPDRLAILLANYPDVAPCYLELEVLETSALDDVQHVSEIMNACISQGVKFSIDDFGTGYSSLTYLKHLPAALLKIDQSFVRDMLVDNDDLTIIKGVIALAGSFKRDVIAEGVESIDHGVALLGLGCELAQGYGIARPMPVEDISTWLDEWQPDVRWQA
ncbi:bifunctional diguanylate cyclase/phosphodiesterase [Methylophaga sp.]|uniref:bifunctional diguanylate cyclase/phosphodiesterase n=1 Tax=Methylophaga sp. TaxID=2024840 RepID=UPI003F69E247